MLIALLWWTLAVSIASADTIIPGGYVSRIWTLAGSPYQIQGDITIHADSMLTIEPGVVVNFQGVYVLTVNGYLEAIGTEADSIHFTASTDWNGLTFENAPDSSHLEYCTLTAVQSFFGLIYCYNSNPVISHCRISDNMGIVLGGGISLANSSPVISYCTISGNSIGGGIKCEGACAPLISHCSITGNSAAGTSGGGIAVSSGGDPVISSCTISGNFASNGGGIAFLDGSNGTITDCNIAADTSSNLGGGVYISSSGGAFTINNSTFSNCRGFEGGGGVYIGQAASVSITGSTFDGNYGGNIGGGAIYSIDCGNLVIDHCDVMNNSTSIGFYWGGIALNGNTDMTLKNCIFRSQLDFDIWFESYSSASVSYSDFYGSGVAPFYGGPPGIGVLTQVNANGDSCDVYSNIYLDPLFVDFPGGDYHLSENSPCIDAGDPASPYDPDGTITDMGRYFFDQSVIGIESNFDRQIPAEFCMHSPYPNPFNPVTTFKVELPVVSWVRLEIFDIGGRPLGFVVDGWRSAGYHEVTFDASGLASGVYVYRLETSGSEATSTMVTGKMVLMK